MDFLDKVIINTESDFIINYVKKYENTKLVTVKRDNKFSLDSTDREFCRNVVSGINEEYVLYSPVTMPFIEKKHIVKHSKYCLKKIMIL